MPNYSLAQEQVKSHNLNQVTLPPIPQEGLQIYPDAVAFLGVLLNKGLGGPNTPDIKRFERNVLTPYDLELMQKLAIGLLLNQPTLIESGSGLGKSETVERMCALLRLECYYANCHDFESDVLIGRIAPSEDSISGFQWKDGIAIQAIRKGGVLFLDEFNFMRGETRGRLHEILDAVLRGKKEIVLIENNGERVKVNPNFRLIAAQNPPGGKFSDREILDPAQLTRFVYLKEPSEMPLDLKIARALGAVDQEAICDGSGLEVLVATNNSIQTIKALAQIREVVIQFIEFEEALERLVENGSLAEDQAQPLHFAFQRDFNRVLDFTAMFFAGDLYETLKQALRYYYKNRFEADLDKRKIEELIDCLGEPAKPNPRKRELRLSLVPSNPDPAPPTLPQYDDFYLNFE